MVEGQFPTCRPSRDCDPTTLLEKSRLDRCIMGIAKIAEANTNEAKSLLRCKSDAFAQ